MNFNSKHFLISDVGDVYLFCIYIAKHKLYPIRIISFGSSVFSYTSAFSQNRIRCIWLLRSKCFYFDIFATKQIQKCQWFKKFVVYRCIYQTDKSIIFWKFPYGSFENRPISVHKFWGQFRTVYFPQSRPYTLGWLTYSKQRNFSSQLYFSIS